MSRAPLHNFAGNAALILHGSDGPMVRIAERCELLGMSSRHRRGDLVADDLIGVDLVILDIDTGDDGQLPWTPGQAPVPIIGLIGSESPGRLTWALAQGVDAFLPLSALGNLFSAVVIAHETFRNRVVQRVRDAAVAQQRGGRLEVIRAVICLMNDGGDAGLALKQLRTMAMVAQVPLEEAARRVVAEGSKIRMRSE